jgi:hypothetical protein
MDNASELYNDVPGRWGKIRKGLRKFGKTNAAFAAWAELLPSQSEYVSVLCGGLKLIFGVSIPPDIRIPHTDDQEGCSPLTTSEG